MSREVEALLAEATRLGATFDVAGGRVKVKAPSPLPVELVDRLRAKKAAILSFYSLPEEARPLVAWATWLAERPPAEEIEVSFHETPLRPVRLRLCDVGRYLSRILGNLAVLQSAEVVQSPDFRPGWRRHQIRELCAILAALREALRPLALAEIPESRP